MDIKPVMTAEEACLEASKDKSDQPDLNDRFQSAPSILSDSILKAGGDPKRTVAWFEAEGNSVYRFVVHGSNAESAWMALRADFERTGYWPVILGPNNSIIGHNSHHLDRKADVIETVFRAGHVNIDQWQLDQQQLRSGYDPEYRRPYSQTGWPKLEESENPVVLMAPRSALSSEPLKHIWIGLFPVNDSCEVPAVMRFGDWNEAPKPEIHVALHRRWKEQFGAELASMKDDVLEFFVSRPPSTREESMRLAELQHDYCPDIVLQGMNTIESLAALLLNGCTWYFWWD